jgi:hypothetical protein
MDIIKFGSFSVNENKGESVTLYRLTSHSVVDLNDPGEFYVKNKKDVDPKMLEKKGKVLFLITVKCSESNIDLDGSDKESAKHNKKVIVVKDSKKCDIVEVVPFKQ